MELIGLTRKTIEAELVKHEMKPFRARQIFQWIYQKLVTEFEEMTDISKEGRTYLHEHFSITPLAAPEVFASADGTEKYRFELADGNAIETVMIPEKERRTLCVSTQVGCPIKCSFCRTGSLGFARNLSVREIVGQVWFAEQRQRAAGSRISNIVFMGMGEPLLNLDAVCNSIEILLDELGFNLSNRRVTVSTVGIPGKLAELGRRTPVNLAISLHAVDNAVREKLIPMAKIYPLKELMKDIREYPLPPRRRPLIEYLMLKGVNDSPAAAQKLVKIVRSIDAKVNLIPFNSYDDCLFEPTPWEEVLAFQQILLDAKLTAIVRKSRGDETLAACGQLGVSRDEICAIAEDED